MGLFDRVLLRCPECGCGVAFQSKAGDCRLRDFEEDAVPTEIAKDISGCVELCNNCGRYVKAEIAPASIVTVAMRGV